VTKTSACCGLRDSSDRTKIAIIVAMIDQTEGNAGTIQDALDVSIAAEQEPGHVPGVGVGHRIVPGVNVLSRVRVADLAYRSGGANGN
jgi:hypothetical protein